MRLSRARRQYGLLFQRVFTLVAVFSLICLTVLAIKTFIEGGDLRIDLKSREVQTKRYIPEAFAPGAYVSIGPLATERPPSPNRGVANAAENQPKRQGDDELTDEYEREHKIGRYRDKDAKRVRTKEAYVSFLFALADDDAEDRDFDQLRRLIWQLTVDPTTKDNKDIVVIASANVSPWRLSVLQDDNAYVHVANPLLEPEKMASLPPNDAEELSKLRIWELIEYDRLLYLDHNHVILGGSKLRNLSSNLWTDESYAPRVIPKRDTGSFTWLQKERYVFAANPYSPEHDPDASSSNSSSAFSTNTFYLTPSKAIFKMIQATLSDVEDEPSVENVLNRVFRSDGYMPWSKLPDGLGFTTLAKKGRRKDLDMKVASIHQKWLYEHVHLTQNTAKDLAGRQGYL